MKIMLVCDSMGIGGAETHVFSLAKGLCREGHCVTVAARSGRLSQRIASESDGVKFHNIYPHGRTPMQMAAYIFALGKIIKREGPGVIHAHSRVTAFAVGVLRSLGIARRSVFIVTAHAKYRTGALLRFFSVWGEKCIAVSDDIREHLAHNYSVGADRITVIPNGVDTDEFCPCPSAPPHTLLFASRLDGDCSHGALCLCEVAERLSRDYPDVRISIAGGGGELERIKAAAEGNDNITLLGELDSLAEAIRDASAVIGVSRVVLEAMAGERNVILFGNEGGLGLLDGGNLKNAEATNFTCRGFGVKDADFLFREIVRLFRMSDGERDELAKGNRKHVLLHHSGGAVVTRTVEVYQRAVQRRKRIVVGGYYGFGNAGDEALRRSIVEWLMGCVPYARISVLNKTRGREGSVRYVKRYSPLSVLWTLCRADLFILGGGSLLQNSTSTRSLVYYCALLRLASLLGCKTVLLSNGLGPLKSRFAERLTSRSLTLADSVSVRDGDSLALARRLGREDVALGADLCFSSEIKPAWSERSRRLKASAKRGYIMIAVKGNCQCDRTPLANEIREFCRERGLVPVFVAMDVPVDSSESKRLARYCKGEFLQCTSAEELLALMSDAYAIVGERLHFLIFALTVGRGYVGIGDAPKVKSFLSETLATSPLNPYCPGELSRLIDESRAFSSAQLLAIYERQKRRSDAGLRVIEKSFLPD